MNSQNNTAETFNKKQSVNRHLCFSLGKEHFSIPLLQVKEVIGLPEFTPIPFAPSYFCGIMNLRGKVISVVDLRKKFAIPSKGPEENCVIVCNFENIIIGALVDSVDMVISVDEKNILIKPSTQTSVNTDYIDGLIHFKDQLLVYLNLVKALNIEDIVNIQKMTQLIPETLK